MPEMFKVGSWWDTLLHAWANFWASRLQSARASSGSRWSIFLIQLSDDLKEVQRHFAVISAHATQAELRDFNAVQINLIEENYSIIFHVHILGKPPTNITDFCKSFEIKSSFNVEQKPMDKPHWLGISLPKALLNNNPWSQLRAGLWNTSLLFKIGCCSSSVLVFTPNLGRPVPPSIPPK